MLTPFPGDVEPDVERAVAEVRLAGADQPVPGWKTAVLMPPATQRAVTTPFASMPTTGRSPFDIPKSFVVQVPSAVRTATVACDSGSADHATATTPAASATWGRTPVPSGIGALQAPPRGRSVTTTRPSSSQAAAVSPSPSAAMSGGLPSIPS